jgi:hypothetical protein
MKMMQPLITPTSADTATNQMFLSKNLHQEMSLSRGRDVHRTVTKKDVVEGSEDGAEEHISPCHAANTDTTATAGIFHRFLLLRQNVVHADIPALPPEESWHATTTVGHPAGAGKPHG